LTTAAGVEAFASWFPDGKRIAFVSAQEGSPPGVSVLDLDAGVTRELFPSLREVNFPKISPDGSRFAFHSGAAGAVNVWTIPLTGGEPTQVTFDPELAGWPCWSPDGSTLAVEVKRGYDTYVGVVPSGGGEIRLLTSSSGQSWTGSWSPDGQRIAFAGQRDGVWNVWWVARGGGRERRVTSFARPNTYVRSPSWSPRGDRIAFEYAEVKGNVWLAELK
jgi:Tol biopolymer transport system component